MGARDVNEAEDVGRSMRRRLDELAETQHWVHHVGDLDSGEVLTTQLDRPVMPLSRAERLSRLGHIFDDTSIFSGPRYRLTPRAPYQAVPEASFSVSGGSLPFVSLLSYSSTHDEVVWQPPRDATGPLLDLLRASFADGPRERSVVSILLSGQARPARLGMCSSSSPRPGPRSGSRSPTPSRRTRWISPSFHARASPRTSSCPSRPVSGS